MSPELFWLISSFTLLVLGLFRPLKNHLHKFVNRQSREASSLIIEALQTKHHAENLKSKLQKLKEKTMQEIEKSKFSVEEEIKSTLQNTKQQALAIRKQYEKKLQEYKKQEQRELENLIKQSIVKKLHSWIIEEISKIPQNEHINIINKEKIQLHNVLDN